MWRRSWWVLAVVVLVAGGLAVLRSGVEAPGAAAFEVTPRAVPADEPMTVAVSGLRPGAITTVSASVEVYGVSWSSSARFRASPDGVVSLGQESLGGSWTGVMPMGLFQLLAPSSSRLAFFGPPTSGWDVALRAEVEGRVVATGTARRLGPTDLGVVRRELRPAAGGLYGELYLPKDTSVRRPAVLVFGGSEGGLTRAYDAANLAAHGYPSLALAYFGLPGLPETLADVPLEYFTSALARLRAAPGVDPEHVLVMGYSRGGEVALLLGARFPDLVNGVIAGVPSAIVNGSSPAGRPAWTLGGRPVPFAGPEFLGSPAAAVDRAAVIPVERIRGPVLLSCGDLDVVWPSCPYTAEIAARLATARRPATVLRYRDAGHFAGNLTGYTPIDERGLVSFGGSVAGTQTALVDGHAKVLALLAAL